MKKIPITGPPKAWTILPEIWIDTVITNLDRYSDNQSG
jgi:hypothetical protein